MIFIYISAIVMIAILIALISYLVIIIKKEEDLPKEITIFENYCPQFAEGNSDGIIKKIEFKNERARVSFIPFNLKDNKPKTIHFLQKQLEFIPKHSFSNSNKLKAYPSRLDLLPEFIKNSKNGKIIMEKITDNNKKQDESSFLIERLKHLDSFIKSEAGMEVAEDLVKTYKGALKDVNFQNGGVERGEHSKDNN